jgi:hypothetical protein
LMEIMKETVMEMVLDQWLELLLVEKLDEELVLE